MNSFRCEYCGGEFKYKTINTESTKKNLVAQNGFCCIFCGERFDMKPLSNKEIAKILMQYHSSLPDIGAPISKTRLMNSILFLEEKNENN